MGQTPGVRSHGYQAAPLEERQQTRQNKRLVLHEAGQGKAVSVGVFGALRGCGKERNRPLFPPPLLCPSSFSLSSSFTISS